jgi:hypothetical protein
MATLDVNRSYAIVGGVRGVCFDQDDKLFNQAGYEVTFTRTPTGEVTVTLKGKKATNVATNNNSNLEESIDPL